MSSANVTITFTQVTKTPAYNLTMTKEQKIEVIKENDAWGVTDTPPATIIQQRYDR
jgi:hypothetical protein